MGISKQIVILTGFTLFGMLSGIFIIRTAGNESQYFENFPAVFLSNWLHHFWWEQYAIHYEGFGFTVPWVLRSPQIYFIISIIFWTFSGLLIQFFYDILKKIPFWVRDKIGLFVLTSITIFCVAVTGFLYFSQSKELRANHPFVPVAYPDWIPLDLNPERLENISTTKITALSISSKKVQEMERFTFDVTIENWGLIKGIVGVELDINNQTITSNGTVLSPKESKKLRFFVIIPKSGSYTIGTSDGFGKLTENIEVSRN